MLFQQDTDLMTVMTMFLLKPFQNRLGKIFLDLWTEWLDWFRGTFWAKNKGGADMDPAFDVTYLSNRLSFPPASTCQTNQPHAKQEHGCGFGDWI
jgi:hypothetical protein